MTRARELGFPAAAMALTLAVAAVVLELWNADVGVPFTYTGDGTLNLVFIKTVLENAWHFENPRLGAPDGLELYDYPVINGETLNLLLFRVVGLGHGNPAVVMNLFFLLTFPLTALTAYVVLRRLPASRGASLVLAVLFALLPYHFMRGEAHLFLAAYYCVPLGAYLALAVFRGDTLFGSRRQILVTAVMCVVVATASGSGYYAVFTVLFVVAAAALRFAVRREREALGAGAAVVAAITAVTLLQLAPTLVQRAVNSQNEDVAQRYWFESENYGLRLTNLVLPVDGHRIEGLARMKQEYVDKIPQTEARAATLGIVATVGFLWLLAVALIACVGGARRYDLGLHVELAALTVVAFVVATTGGLATLIAVAWPQIRAWNRLSVFLAFFAFAAVALLLGRMERRLPAVASAVVLALILAVGIFDQTTKAFVPPYTAAKSAWNEDEAFYSELEAGLPDRAMVVQLPYETFPEPPATRQAIYEPAKAYLHTDDLRWSYGAMRGRSADWLASLAGRPVGDVIAAARERGFAGVLVDRLGYADGGTAIEAELRAAGAAPQRSANNRFLFLRL